LGALLAGPSFVEQSDKINMETKSTIYTEFARLLLVVGFLMALMLP